MMRDEYYQIYKSEQRGTVEGNRRRSFFCFNEGVYQHESRKPVGMLQQFSEHYLYPSRSLELEAGYSFILIPIENEIHITDGITTWNISPQEVLLISAGSMLQIRNVLTEEICRFYSIQISIPPVRPTIRSFELIFRNELISLIESPEISLKMGLFDGREEGEIIVRDKKNVFVSIINGAFEVQNRLLEIHDSLFIQNDPLIAFESLSENAIMLTLAF